MSRRQGEIFIAAVKRFGVFTMKNYVEAVEWIQAEREKRGLDSPHYVHPANVTPFRDVATEDEMTTEDGWR